MLNGHFKLWRGWPALCLLILFLESAAVLAVAWLAPQPFSDEQHFIATIRQFGQGLSVELLKSYNELSTPLTFWLYALWGKVFGFDLWALRACSVAMAVGAYVLLYLLLCRALDNQAAALFGTAMFMIQPYAMALSALVYTDMSALLFAMAALLGWQRGRAWLLGVGLAGAMLCRQYTAFMTVAVLICEGIGLWRGDVRRSRWMLLAAVLACVPMAALAALWSGMSPVNALRQQYGADGLSFHPRALVLYVCLIPVYALPVLIAARRAVFGRLTIWVAALLLSWVYWLWPVGTSPVAVAEGIGTVGILHHALRITLGNGVIQHAVWFICFIAGTAVVLVFVKDWTHRVRSGRMDFAAGLDLAVIIFLIMMPWSYLHWEKYLLPLLPVLFARALMMRVAPSAEPALDHHTHNQHA